MNTAIPKAIWTVLPQKIDPETGDLLFSISISFRLEQEGRTKLSDYSIHTPTGWPELLERPQSEGGPILSLLCQQNPAAVPISVPVAIDTSKLRPELWQALFKDDALVSKFEFQDNSKRPMYSYSVKAVEQEIDDLYEDYVNQKPDQLPDLNDDDRGLFFWGALKGRSLRKIAQAAKVPNASGFSAGPDPDLGNKKQFNIPAGSESDWYDAYRFYHRSASAANAQRSTINGEALAPPELDFHDVIGSLGDFPEMLRMLGLVLDCRVLAADFATIPTDWAFMRIETNWQDAQAPVTEDLSPWTRVRISQDRKAFGAWSANESEISARGFLRVDDPDLFGVYQTDVDGNPLKMMDFSFNLFKMINGPGWDPRKTNFQGLPSQVTGGITLVRNQRDQKVYEELLAQKQINENIGQAELEASTLVRGYRVDVKYNGRWHSLCDRTVDYQVGELSSFRLRDEGYVKAVSASGQIREDGEPDDLYLHQAICGWENWSLVAGRPGATISFDSDDQNRQSVAIRREDGGQSEFPFRSSVQATPGTLPRMRFGETYSLRVRTVDLGGYSMSMQEADALDAEASTKSVNFRRYEAVPAPVLVMRNPISLAESLETMVVRTSIGEIDDSMGFSSEFFENDWCRRFVAPPKSTLHHCELHGALDSVWSDPQRSYAIAQREGGSLNDPGLGLLYEGANKFQGTGNFPEGYVVGDPLPVSAAGLHVYVVAPGDSLEVPYLPDPMAKGFVLHGLEDTTIQEASFSYRSTSGSWPELQARDFSVRRGAVASNTALHQRGESVELWVPPGETINLRYSSALDSSAESLLAHIKKLNPEKLETLRQRDFQHWMLSPWRELKIVHAVQKPVFASHVHGVFPTRKPGETFSRLDAVCEVGHVQSTQQVSLVGSWEEWEDDVGSEAPVSVRRSGHVFEKEIAYDSESMLRFPTVGSDEEAPTQEFGDTKHRVVDYRFVATTRYREFYPPEFYANLKNISRDDGDVVTVSIPSSARPAPPKILYVIPTFRWDEKESQRVRYGGGLRIYLDRPWYSSGQDEKLGVVVAPASANQNVSEKLAPLVSQWGRDPIYEGRRLAPLRAQDFRSAPDLNFSVERVRAFAEEPLLHLSLRQEEEYAIPVIAYEPSFDAERKLWFVDLEIDPTDTYSPFVRLSLARYQKESLEHLELSSIVKAQFMQLQADRFLSYYKYPTAHGIRVGVSLTGTRATNYAGSVQAGQWNGSCTRASFSRGVSGDQSEAYAPGGDIWESNNASTLPRGARYVTAQFQVAPSPDADEIAWEKGSDEILMEDFRNFSPVEPRGPVWRKYLNLDRELAARGAIRVVVREYEVFETDETLAETDVPENTHDVNHPRKRLVYADVVHLD